MSRERTRGRQRKTANRRRSRGLLVATKTGRTFKYVRFVGRKIIMKHHSLELGGGVMVFLEVTIHRRHFTGSDA